MHTGAPFDIWGDPLTGLPHRKNAKSAIGLDCQIPLKSTKPFPSRSGRRKVRTNTHPDTIAENKNEAVLLAQRRQKFINNASAKQPAA